MTDSRRQVGRDGEALVVAQARAWGWQVRATNWRCRFGEIDVIAQEGPCLVLAEVRTRRSERRGTPEESVGPRKQRRLATLAEHYVQSVGWEGPWRVDVFAVVLGPDGRVARLTHYPDALEGG
ncbi:YraN family protein [bacterium]|nr:MAG: YraN family protein [bacterium]